MDHFIPLAEAVAMTARYRANRDAILASSYQHLDLLPLCETFERGAFDVLLSKANCSAIRVYYGMDEDLKIHAIIVAADEAGRDILPSDTLVAGEEEDIVERANRCPPLCPDASPLNS